MAVSPVEGPPVAVSVPVAEPSVESVIEPVIESTPPVLQEAAIPAQASTNWLMVGIILVLSVTLAAVGMMAVVFFMKPG